MEGEAERSKPAGHSLKAKDTAAARERPIDGEAERSESAGHSLKAKDNCKRIARARTPGPARRREDRCHRPLRDGFSPAPCRC